MYWFSLFTVVHNVWCAANTCFSMEQDLLIKSYFLNNLQNMGEPNSLGAASGEKCQTTTPFDCHSCQPDPGFDGQSFDENFFVF